MDQSFKRLAFRDHKGTTAIWKRNNQIWRASLIWYCDFWKRRTHFNIIAMTWQESRAVRLKTCRNCVVRRTELVDRCAVNIAATLPSMWCLSQTQLERSLLTQLPSLLRPWWRGWCHFVWSSAQWASRSLPYRKMLGLIFMKYDWMTKRSWYF